MAEMVLFFYYLSLLWDIYTVSGWASSLWDTQFTSPVPLSFYCLIVCGNLLCPSITVYNEYLRACLVHPYISHPTKCFYYNTHKYILKHLVCARARVHMREHASMPMCMSLCGYLHLRAYAYGSIRCPWSWVTGNCELYNMGSRNQNPVLCKSSAWS